MKRESFFPFPKKKKGYFVSNAPNQPAQSNQQATGTCTVYLHRGKTHRTKQKFLDISRKRICTQSHPNHFSNTTGIKELIRSFHVITEGLSRRS
jgi:hypothetical protein